MRVDAYGRDLEIRREAGSWQVFHIGNEGKKRPAREITIPPSVRPDQVVDYLADLLHEYASARHPEVCVRE